MLLWTLNYVFTFKFFANTNSLAFLLCRAFMVIPETTILPRQPSTIIGCLCRHHYPGLVSIGDGEEEPAWSWEHWKRAPDTKDKWGREYRNAAERVVNDFWVKFLVSFHSYFFSNIQNHCIVNCFMRIDVLS